MNLKLVQSSPPHKTYPSQSSGAGNVWNIILLIDNGNISGISQQYYTTVYPFMSFLGKTPELVLESVQKLWQNIKGKLEYKTCVLDVYIVYDEDGEMECKLIEINGCGRWGAAGSSLYEWEKDDPLDNPLELRIKI